MVVEKQGERERERENRYREKEKEEARKFLIRGIRGRDGSEESSRATRMCAYVRTCD
ncbi:hypothetical protein X777_00642 [Ooceraea biroi]|uniref:Uncharacterized protein n=1 Tax=Ooceraea biroi TaxID=2015173 RepID=A0A026X4E5_OOCBI|nr:hypothetical protein X777_00642 [Ooceraea biroi]